MKHTKINKRNNSMSTKVLTAQFKKGLREI